MVTFIGEALFPPSSAILAWRARRLRKFLAMGDGLQELNDIELVDLVLGSVEVAEIGVQPLEMGLPELNRMMR